MAAPLDTRHRVAVLALEDAVPFDIGTATQVFRTARDSDDRRLYAVQVCTPDGAPVRTSAGFELRPEHGLEALHAADTVVVAGVHGGPAMYEGTLEPKIAEALREVAATGTRLMSICTGAFVLAAIGILDGRPATTHWAHAARFRQLYPRVRLDPDVLFVDDGDVLTSAGIGAGIDLCLHVVRRDHGSEIANQTARRCVVPPWRDGGQSQYIERPLPSVTGATTEPTRRWLLERLDERLDLAEMAAHARMSVRSFTRRFRDETGMSPGTWLLRQRVERARHLLEATDLPIDRVARDAGFGTAASMRQHLREALGVAPLAYRRTFRGTT
ncbi:GlxA family transcriptional regulator [Actinopolymorpha alba]|uniref:GlxA family transcriptional regulator n=1 Tax=Actinopolymorpha alba TaxID=533267 RepID=UPI000379DE27|nr:helix-turn-helix domain-containing protein [Actinopolymorpha alba]